MIRLLSNEVDGVVMDEIDAEAVHYAAPATAGSPGYYYITGSHGLSRKAGQFKPFSFFLFRVPVDPQTCRPGYPFDDESMAPEIRRTALLRDALRLSPALPLYAERQLDQCGLSVEGLAVHGQELLIGLRAPSIDSNAFVLRFAMGELFTDAVPRSKVKRLPLGLGVGVRDFASVRSGVLILAGRSLDSEPDP